MNIKIMAVLSLGLLCGCPPAVKPEADAEARRAVMTQVIDRVLLPTVEAFVVESETLAVHAEAWRQARLVGPAVMEREVIRASFRRAFLRWQRAEMMAFGPAGKPPTFSLGQSLRDTIYAWPTINPCRVDTVLAAKSYATAGFFEGALVTSTGLAAIEQALAKQGYKVNPGAAVGAANQYYAQA